LPSGPLGAMCRDKFIEEDHGKMSKIEICPQCGARCKTTVEKESGKVHYQALQDEDAFKKIELLKKQIMKKEAQ